MMATEGTSESLKRALSRHGGFSRTSLSIRSRILLRCATHVDILDILIYSSRDSFRPGDQGTADSLANKIQAANTGYH